MKKSIVLLIFFLLFFIGKCESQVGVGITTYRIELRGSIGESYTYTIGIMNPSSQTTTVNINFECLNCISEVKIFNTTIFEKIDDVREYFTIDKEIVEVPGYTNENNAVPVSIKFAPKILIKKYLKFYTPEWIDFFIKIFKKDYKGSFSVPYYTIFIGKKEIEGKLAADVIGYAGGVLGVRPSVAATLTMTAYGMPLMSFLIVLVVIIYGVYLIAKRYKERFLALLKKTRKK